MAEQDTPHRVFFDPDAKLIGLSVGKVEFGQHVHDAYRLIVAGVLGADPSRVVVLPVSTATSPDDGMTVGSQSIQVTGVQIEAAARDMLEALLRNAALRLNGAAEEVRFDAEDMVFRIGSSACDLSDLLDPDHGADLTQTPDRNPILGQKQFIQDLVWPGMVHARALRGRAVGEVRAELNPEDRLIESGGFAAIVARDEARLASLCAKLPEVAAPGGTRFDGPVGDWMEEARSVDIGSETDMAEFPHTVTTSRPFILHGSIAPSCGIAFWSGRDLTIWSHSQGIFPLRAQIARVLGLETDRVEIRHVQSAGCYGHSGADDAAMDAAMVAMQSEGVHVRVVWPREDDLRAAPAGAPMLVRAAAKLGSDNRIAAWHQQTLSAPHGQRPGGGGNVNLLGAMEMDPSLRPGDIGDLPAAVGHGAGRNGTPIYDIPETSAQIRIVQDLPVRTSSLRGLGAQMNTVAIEVLMDQIAGELDECPVEFRRRHLSDPRAIAVLDALSDRLPNAEGPEEAVGLALGRYKNKAAYAAVAVHLRLEDEPKPLRITAIVDAGRVISADGARNQIEGGIVQAASWTLCEGVHLRGGQIDARTWDDYPVLGWDRIPDLDVHLVDGPDAAPLGVGECMVGPVSAAIVNAVSRCVGQPITHLPLNRDALIAALA